MNSHFAFSADVCGWSHSSFRFFFFRVNFRSPSRTQSIELPRVYRAVVKLYFILSKLCKRMLFAAAKLGFFKSFVHVRIYKEGGAFFALGVRSFDECSNVYYVYLRAEQITCNLLHRKVRSPDVI